MPLALKGLSIITSDSTIEKYGSSNGMGDKTSAYIARLLISVN